MRREPSLMAGCMPVLEVAMQRAGLKWKDIQYCFEL